VLKRKFEIELCGNVRPFLSFDLRQNSRCDIFQFNRSTEGFGIDPYRDIRNGHEYRGMRVCQIELKIAAIR
jgi:hypothetical protein